MMYQYKLYGLNISSSRRISLLNEEFFSKADLAVEWKVNGEPLENEFEWETVN